jgi:hypothetical protein
MEREGVCCACAPLVESCAVCTRPSAIKVCRNPQRSRDRAHHVAPLEISCSHMSSRCSSPASPGARLMIPKRLLNTLRGRSGSRLSRGVPTTAAAGGGSDGWRSNGDGSQPPPSSQQQQLSAQEPQQRAWRQQGMRRGPSQYQPKFQPAYSTNGAAAAADLESGVVQGAKIVSAGLDASLVSNRACCIDRFAPGALPRAAAAAAPPRPAGLGRQREQPEAAAAVQPGVGRRPPQLRAGCEEAGGRGSQPEAQGDWILVRCAAHALRRWALALLPFCRLPGAVVLASHPISCSAPAAVLRRILSLGSLNLSRVRDSGFPGLIPGLEPS